VAALVTAAPIPRTIHHIWLGSPLPARFASFRATWAAAHPMSRGWRHVLWGDAEAAAFPLRNRAAFEAATNWGEKSDILRYEVLHAQGGVYVDTDFECVRPLDELLERRVSFFAGVSNTGTVELNNGLIGAAPRHRLLARLIEAVRPDSGVAALRSVLAAGGGAELVASLDAALGGGTTHTAGAGSSTIARTGPGLFTRVFMEAVSPSRAALVGGPSGADGATPTSAAALPLLEAVALPCSFFYPMPNGQPQATAAGQRAHFVRPETFALHHYACSWQG
jgi:hypothetical protein